MNHVCTICNKQCQSDQGLKMHISKSHPEETERSLLCNKCEKTFATYGNRMKHEKNCQKIPEHTVLQVQELQQKQKTIEQLLHQVKQFNEVLEHIQPTQINLNKDNKALSIEEKLKCLQPIQNSLIVQGIHQRIKQVCKDKQLFTVQEFSEYLAKNVFEQKILCTDRSRKTFQWIDGDNQNKQIKDPSLKILSNKIQLAVQTYLKSSKEFDIIFKWICNQVNVFSGGIFYQESLQLAIDSQFVIQMLRINTQPSVFKGSKYEKHPYLMYYATKYLMNNIVHFKDAIKTEKDDSEIFQVDVETKQTIDGVRPISEDLHSIIRTLLALPEPWQTKLISKLKKLLTCLDSEGTDDIELNV